MKKNINGPLIITETIIIFLIIYTVASFYWWTIIQPVNLLETKKIPMYANPYHTLVIIFMLWVLTLIIKNNKKN